MRSATPFWKHALLVAITALSLLPASAIAQDASGKFTLSRQVRWGMVTLPPGDYTYSIEYGSADTVFLRNAAGSAMIVLVASVSTADPDADRLILQNRGGEWFVSSLMLTGPGEELHFNVPKATLVAQDAPSRRTRLAGLSKP